MTKAFSELSRCLRGAQEGRAWSNSQVDWDDDLRGEVARRGDRTGLAHRERDAVSGNGHQGDIGLEILADTPHEFAIVCVGGKIES